MDTVKLNLLNQNLSVAHDVWLDNEDIETVSDRVGEDDEGFWESMIDSLASFSRTFKQVYEKDFIFEVLNPFNKDDVILILNDEEVIYNFAEDKEMIKKIERQIQGN